MKFDGADNAGTVYNRVRPTGAEDVIDFAFDDIPRTPNTTDARRLIRWAAGQDRDSETLEALFQAYFFRGQDIGSLEVLTAAAASVGLDAGEAQAFLESEELAAEIGEEDRQARRSEELRVGNTCVSMC